MSARPQTHADPTATTAPLRGVLPADSRLDERGRLVVGGCELTELAERFGTPAYVYAERDLRRRAQEYRAAFESRAESLGGAEVLFASKAAPITALYSLFAEEGLSVDVASEGELRLALAGGFDPARVYMHGNNKSERELRLGLEAGIGYFVLDSLEELALLDSLCEERLGAAERQRVLVRVTPGVDADTHAAVMTGQRDSKFGLALEDGSARLAVERVRASRRLRLSGLHAHVGSQLLELRPYELAIEALAELADEQMELVNVGGGLGIAYGEAERPPAVERFAEAAVGAVERAFPGRPRVLAEPGRSLVGTAGITLYSVGAIKQAEGGRRWLAVDGGMSDNLRPMLYGSRYEALLADRAAEPGDTLVTVAGKHCESGDVLIGDVALPDPQRGDVLVVPATGAYGHAMANNYNAVPRPPVILCADGRARQVVRRETTDDLLARDVG